MNERQADTPPLQRHQRSLCGFHLLSLIGGWFGMKGWPFVCFSFGLFLLWSAVFVDFSSLPFIWMTLYLL